MKWHFKSGKNGEPSRSKPTGVANREAITRLSGMNAWDWLLVVVLNGGIIGYGFFLSRDVKSSSDWFLASRRLPWWLVGVSMYATAIDTSDLVADSGATYTLGISYFVTNWVGVVGGWAVAAFFICLPMYRAGMYTNAEYLEARFGPAARVICALIQVQYRTLVMAIMGMAIYLTLTIVGDWSSTQAWIGLAAIATLAAVYTALGGLRSVAVTDALQFVVMTVAAIIIWSFVWGEVGGWNGIESRLADVNAELPNEMLHAGYDNIVREDVAELFTTQEDADPKEIVRRKLLLGGAYDPKRQVIAHRTPAWLVALGFVIMGVGYSVVNHTQSMRMLASKTEWHLKMTVFAAAVPMLVMTFFNLTIGIMGRALFPEQDALPLGRQDSIYPHLVSQFAVPGLKGLVVAGILAAALSTYDSMGSALSALLTRDVYARLFVRDREDRHYLRVGQWLTPAIIAVSFLYMPFLEGGMLMFYLDLTSAFVIPLLTLFLLGALTRVHRRSGLIGLAVGATYGVLRLLAPWLAEQHGIRVMPAFMTNTYAAYPISLLLTAGTMILMSLRFGWEERAGLLHEETGEWLRASQTSVRQLAEEISVDAAVTASRLNWLPIALATAVVAAGCILSFLIFW